MPDALRFAVDPEKFPPPTIAQTLSTLRLKTLEARHAALALLRDFATAHQDPDLPAYDTQAYWQARFDHPQKNIDWQIGRAHV